MPPQRQKAFETDLVWPQCAHCSSFEGADYTRTAGLYILSFITKQALCRDCIKTMQNSGDVAAQHQKALTAASLPVNSPTLNRCGRRDEN